MVSNQYLGKYQVVMGVHPPVHHYWSIIHLPSSNTSFTDSSVSGTCICPTDLCNEGCRLSDDATQTCNPANAQSFTSGTSYCAGTQSGTSLRRHPMILQQHHSLILDCTLKIVMTHRPMFTRAPKKPVMVS